MQERLKVILEIQQFDMKMIRLIRLRKDREKELHHISSLRSGLREQLEEKQTDIGNLSLEISTKEMEIQEVREKIEKLEAKQSSVKKVDEFNALTQEITVAEREKVTTEQTTSDLIDRRTMEQEILEKIKESLLESEESSKALEEEIRSSIYAINEEGQSLKKERDLLAQTADPEYLRVYEKLLHNRKDQVVVPIENRTCSGCHITLTAQHENLVRRGEHLVFCEHCSRIHYWLEEATTTATQKRRRRRSAGAFS
ncbi:MAG: C4-type zinc ribbon domain-containing protein [Chlamydiota bacterium]